MSSAILLSSSAGVAGARQIRQQRSRRVAAVQCSAHQQQQGGPLAVGAGALAAAILLVSTPAGAELNKVRGSTVGHEQ